MRATLCGLLVLIALLAGGAVARAQDGAELRIVHAGMELGTVDVRLDGEVIASGVPAGQSTAYLRVPPGDHTVSFMKRGSDDPESLVAGQTVTLAADSAYTLLLFQEPRGASASLLTDELDPGAGDGNGSIRVVNALADGMSIVATTGDTTLSSLLAPGAGGDRTLSPSASLVVTIRREGGTTLLTTPDLPLGGGDFYTLFVAGRSIAPHLILVSYPLGALATTQSVAPPTAPSQDRPSVHSTAVPAPRPLPNTGLLDVRTSLPLLMILDGALLFAVGIAVAWLLHRRLST